MDFFIVIIFIDHFKKHERIFIINIRKCIQFRLVSLFINFIIIETVDFDI